jgi:hypothetical protein
MHCVGVAAEGWERPFAWATVSALLKVVPSDCKILVPDIILPVPSDLLGSGDRITIVKCPSGFLARDQVRALLVGEAADRPLLAVDAGSRPGGNGQDAVFTWSGVSEQTPPYAPSFSRPIHQPPVRHTHGLRKAGRMDVWRVDTGTGYFKSIADVEGRGGVWSQYGEDAPVFVYNTNRFHEMKSAPKDKYYILGSGLLGLRMVMESEPDDSAELVIYDINPKQISWVECVLEHAHENATLADLISSFKELHPEAKVRPVAPHEAENARLQDEWYANNRQGLARLNMLRRTHLKVDLLTETSVLIDSLKGARSVSFLYLDLFVVWHHAGRDSWVEEYPDLAAAFRQLVRAECVQSAEFFPSEHEQVQIATDSPYV